MPAARRSRSANKDGPNRDPSLSEATVARNSVAALVAVSDEAQRQIVAARDVVKQCRDQHKMIKAYEIYQATRAQFQEQQEKAFSAAVQNGTEIRTYFFEVAAEQKFWEREPISRSKVLELCELAINADQTNYAAWCCAGMAIEADIQGCDGLTVAGKRVDDAECLRRAAELDPTGESMAAFVNVVGGAQNINGVRMTPAEMLIRAIESGCADEENWDALAANMAEGESVTIAGNVYVAENDFFGKRKLVVPKEDEAAPKKKGWCVIQ